MQCPCHGGGDLQGSRTRTRSTNGSRKQEFGDARLAHPAQTPFSRDGTPGFEQATRRKRISPPGRRTGANGQRRTSTKMSGLVGDLLGSGSRVDTPVEQTVELTQALD